MTFPEFDDEGQEISAFENVWRDISPQEVLGADCFLPQVDINADDNLLILNLTGQDFRKMFSALYNGAEMTYPDEFLQIVTNFLKGIHCPPELDAEEGDCFNYPAYSPFIEYQPNNPFNEPDVIPDGYAAPPFLVNSELEYPDEFGYLATDVFVPFGAITIAPENLLTLNYPTIKITVQGSGQVELDLLSVIFGGYAVVKVGSPPNIGDILGEIIIEAGLRIIDLDNDSTSLPPESDIIIAEEINIEAGVGVQTDVYIVFLPKLNDALLPLGFGGGIRNIGLCGFEAVGSISTLEDIRFNTATCTFEKRVAGTWETMTGGDEWLDCVPTSGGGSGTVGLKVTNYNVDFANQDTTSTTMVKAVGTAINHTFTKEKAIVIAEFMTFNNGSNNTYAEVRVAGNLPVTANPSRRQLNSNSTVVNAANFEAIALGSREVAIYYSAQAGTARIVGAARCTYTIIEYDNASDLFVEDIRIVGREIQKKIGGAWITVSDSLDALFDAIDTQISAINATNATQQTTINTHTSQISSLQSTVGTHTTQIASIQAINTTQGALLTAHEARLDDIDLSIAGLLVEQAVQNGRLDDLEATSGGGLGAWGGYRLRAITDITTNGGKYSSSTNTWDSGSFPFDFIGWEPNAFSDVKVMVENAGRFNSMCYLRVGIVVQTYVAGSEFIVRVNGGEWSNILPNSSGNYTGLVKIQQIDQFPIGEQYDMEIELQSSNSGNEWRFKAATWFYINVNPFDGTTSD